MENKPSVLTIKLNGDPSWMCYVELGPEIDNMSTLKAQIASSMKIKTNEEAKLYSEDGVELLEDDFYFLKSDEEYFYSPKGISF